jgi:hypothetical protein
MGRCHSIQNQCSSTSPRVCLRVIRRTIRGVIGRRFVHARRFGHWDLVAPCSPAFLLPAPSE